MLSRVKTYLSGIIAVIAIMVALPAAVFAAPYGQGGYNNCSYNCLKAASQPQTNVTLPSGLVGNINLNDGQKIPGTGYVVVVQPASGQAGSLKTVDFYLNGTLQFSGTPNDQGAVRWLWQPDATTGDMHIKIVVTAADGTVSTREFTVTIGTPATTPTPITTSAPQSNDVINTVSRAVLGFVGTLPTPVLYSIPYFLFVLLLVNIVLLLAQTQREIREVAVLQHIIEIERKTGLEKSTFISLASHYLRTPISIIQGGLDLLNRISPLDPQARAAAQQATENMRLKVDMLLARSDAASQIASEDTNQPRITHAWKNPGLYLPILLIGLFAVAFDYVASHVESFNVSQLNVIVQMVAFALLAVVFYQVFRRRQLRTRDTRGMQAALAHEQAINQTRDELITESASWLGGELDNLSHVVQQTPSNQALSFITDGITRFRGVLRKFAIAGQLRSGHALAPKETHTSLATMFPQLPKQVMDKLARKQLALTTVRDADFAVANQQLIAYVLSSLIDNAADSSQDAGAIEIAAEINAGNAVVTVTDHGAGISPEKLSLLFRPFSQTQDVERLTHEGMGFSLYLDKLILTYLGGTISLVSKPGVATTATVTLPV
jgi:signal transduction histidine kinase